MNPDNIFIKYGRSLFYPCVVFIYLQDPAVKELWKIDSYLKYT